MSEFAIMHDIMLEAPRRGCRLFRNNVGLFGPEGQKVRTGLCTGSSDLIGWTSRGFFLAVEVKTPRGRMTPEQTQFIQAVNSAGGVAIVARSVNEFIEGVLGK